jgi:hypothetical protein
VSRPALLLVLCVALLAACGEEPDDPPRVFDVKAPRGSEPADFPDVGVSFTRPANWRLRRTEAPGVFQLVSGQALVAGWVYPREEPLPETDAELEGARERLIDAIEARDPEYEIQNAAAIDVAGAPAIDVTGRQVISKLDLRTRSVHVFEGEVEYVIEAIAPPGDFELVESGVLTPLLDSLELEGEVAEDAG